MKTLTAKELALYLGCEVSAGGQIEELTQIDIAGTVETMFRGHLINYRAIDEVKPILRPLSDITEEEMMQINRIMQPDHEISSEDLVEALAMLKRRGMKAIDFDGVSPNLVFELTAYFLYRGFDLFNWIDQGLALDATKRNAIEASPNDSEV